MTTLERQQETMRKNRKVLQKGENNGNSKLSDRQVQQMRELREWGLTQKELAVRFGVSQCCVSMILSGKSRGVK